MRFKTSTGGAASPVPLFLTTAHCGGLDSVLEAGGLRRRAQQIGSDFCVGVEDSSEAPSVYQLNDSILFSGF